MPHKIGEVFIILPEFCSHDFYHGWHLYERDRADGSRNDDGDWGWIRRSSLVMVAVVRLCKELGHSDMPPVGHDNKFIDEFARRFPRGIKVRLAEYGELVPLEVNR